jgi:phenylalanyl-tRNA synthetase beta chain
MGKVIGGITTVHPLLLREFKVKSGQVAIAVLDLSSFEEREIKEKNTYKPLPKFPGVIFDCTVLADHKAPVTEILASMKKLKAKEFKESKIVTVFPMEDKKAVTLRSLFADEERTLPSELIKELENKVITTLAQAGYALKV